MSTEEQANEPQKQVQAKMDKTTKRKLERHRKAERILAKQIETGVRLPNPIPEGAQASNFVQYLTKQLRYAYFLTKPTPNFYLNKNDKLLCSDLKQLAVFHRFIARTCQTPVINSKRRDERIIYKSKMSKEAGEKEIELVPHEFKVLVLAANVNRLQDLQLSCNQLAVCGILSYHYTLEYHVRMISCKAYQECTVAICNVSRILNLIQRGAVVCDKVEKIMLDWSYIDQKNRCMMEYDNVRSQTSEILGFCSNAEVVIL